MAHMTSMVSTGFGNLLRRLRLAAGLTQEELAARARLSRRGIADLERGVRQRPRNETVLLLAEALELSAEDRAAFVAAARRGHLGQAAVAADAPARPPAPDLPAGTNGFHRHNLPIQLTSFVGRERELAELTPLLAQTRLLTLTGPGGTGKTRLALRLAADVVDAFADGVWLVELAPLADPALVPQAVARVLGAREQPGAALMDALRTVLRPKRLLLVLDNCEHLVAACAALAETLLRAAPGLRILASSREALGIAGETAYRVPSLPLPELRDETLNALARNDCVRLFVERAAASHPPFRLTASNAPAIAQIGRRLDGIPLALELAAARTQVLAPDQLVARLDDRFRLLTAGRRTALARHQTLRALIDWSHDLLTEPERVLLRRLAVFAGGFLLEAAQAVGGEGLGADVLETLARLVEQSLVEVDAAPNAPEARYRLLETIRQYARERLVAAGEMESARNRHLAYCIQLAEEAAPHLRAAEQLAWLERLDVEHDNLRAALAWALERGASAHALCLAGALYYFWELRGYWGEGTKGVDDALALSARRRSGELAAGEDAASGLPPREEVAYRARALYAAARMRFGAQFDAPGSLALVEESLRLWRELDDTWWMAVALEHVAFLLIAVDLPAAIARVEEGVALAREVEDRWPLVLCLGRLAYALATAGEEAAARRMGEEAMALARSVGDMSVLSFGRLGLVVPSYWQDGNLSAAAEAAAQSLAEARAIGSATQILVALLFGVFTACLQGDLARARKYCAQVVAYCREIGASQWLMLALLGFGAVACFGGEWERGVRLLAAGQTRFSERGFDLTKVGPGFQLAVQTMEQAQAQLGPAAFQAAWAEGEQMTVEEALALATEGDGADAPLPEAGR